MDPGLFEMTLDQCERRAARIISNGEGGRLNEAQLTVLLLYSAEFGDKERGSFFTAINTVLRNQNRDVIQPFRHVIWLLMWALKESPPFNGVVFRGVKLDISID